MGINASRFRPYEISLYSLNDRYITTLKSIDGDFIGQINSPKMSLKTDGTETLSFDIPQKIFSQSQNEKIDNPLWKNVQGGLIISNMRKLKVVFDKATEKQRIYEFLITSVTRERSGRELWFRVSAEGLAFHELGKIGNDLTLNLDEFELEYEKDTTIIANINYWLDKVFPHNGDKWLTSWRYRVEMDWSERDGILPNVREKIESENPDGLDFFSNKIYEDSEITNWAIAEDGTALSPISSQEVIEKCRFVDIKESNKYNITQELAEIFGVYCRYEYTYDEYNHILYGTAIFYNHFIKDENPFHVNYEHNMEGMSRTDDSVNLVSKTYVSPIDSSVMTDGQISIVNTLANPTLEDYILNFDYLYAVGAITDAQFATIPAHKASLRKINLKLREITEHITNLTTEQNELKISQGGAQIKRDSAREQITSYETMLAQISREPIHREESNPYYAIFTMADEGYWQANITLEGVLTSEAIRVYKDYNCKGLVSDFSGNANGFSLVTDDNGYCVGIIAPQSFFGKGQTFGESRRCYITLTYSPANKYESLVQKLTNTANQASAQLAQDTEKITLLEKKIDAVQAELEQAQEEKRALIQNFDNMMGASLREGRWQPQDQNTYLDVGEYHQVDLTLGQAAGTTKFFLDEEPFTEEQLSYYYVSNEDSFSQKKQYYYAVRFSEEGLIRLSQNREEENFHIRVHRTTAGGIENPLDLYPRSGFSYVLLKDNSGNVHPCALITRDDAMTFEGYSNLEVKAVVNGEETSPDLFLQSNPIGLLGYFFRAENCNVVYPRIVIDQDNINVDTIDLSLNANGEVKTLSIYEDYSVLLRNLHPYITPKVTSNISFNSVSHGTFQLNYKVSRSNERLYYDAIQVAKDSSIPQVTYKITVKSLPQELSIQRCNIGQLVYVNDYELKFYNIQGYISEIQLELDNPSEDKITIQDYKTKFEDLFSRIVASSEQMYTHSFGYNRAAAAFDSTGAISGSILQQSLENNDVYFNFSNSKVSISDSDGIVVKNDKPYQNGVYGIVAIRGGGIFLSDSMDEAGNYIYHTGITPSGINASVINAGQLDTNKIRIFSGDNLRFSWDSEGLNAFATNEDGTTNFLKYIRFNEDGLLYTENSRKIVSLGWDGLYIGAQDGSVELDGANGFTVFNGADDDPNRKGIVRLGRFVDDLNHYSYGLRLYDNAGKETLISENDGTLWLKQTLSMGGHSGDDAVVGITSAGVANGKYSPVRFWAGSANRENAPFIVREDGSMLASNATITGTIHATDGEFSGTITATEGSIGGWTINENSLSSGNIVLNAGGVNGANINVNNKFKVDNNGNFTATSANIQGTITATSGQIGNLTIQDVNNLAGDKNAVTIEVESIEGNIYQTNSAKTFTFVATAKRGNIPFTEEEYGSYTIQWEVSTDGTNWQLVNNQTSRTLEYRTLFNTNNYYVRCKFTSKN